MPAKPFALLDRDGTIIVDMRYLSTPDGVKLLPGAVEGLQRMRELGLGLVQVSNQSGVGRGYFTDAHVARVNARLAELLREQGLEMDRAYYCPHAPDQECDCRKPAPGMAIQAAEELGFELTECFVIGDKASDVRLGQAVNAAGSILVLTGDGSEERSSCEPDFVAKDLVEAAEWIATRLAEKN